MNRIDFLKNVTALGAATVLPKLPLLKTENKEKQFHFIGIGGAGTNIVIHFSKKTNGIFTAVNDKFSYEITENERVNTIVFNKNKEDFTLNLIKLRSEIFNTERLKNKDIHFVVLAALGGLQGSYLSSALINILENENQKYTAIYAIPFKFEGQYKEAIANIFIKGTKQNKNIQYVFGNDLIKKFPNLKMKDVFSKFDNEIFETWLIENNINFTKK